MTLLDDIERLRLHAQLESLIRYDMLFVFDERHPASEFLTEEYFVEHYIYNEDRWPTKVTNKVIDLIQQHDTP